jgi:hypothetical protein
MRIPNTKSHLLMSAITFSDNYDLSMMLLYEIHEKAAHVYLYG